MFSDNNRISVRQIKYMLLLEWIAKLSILLPVCLAGRTIGSLIFCVMIGTAVWTIVSNMMLSWMQPGEDFADALKRTVGAGATVIFCAAGLLFFLVQAAVFLNLSAELAAVYLLPRIPVPVLCLLPLAAAVYLSAGSIEVRGRFCEVIGPIVAALIILLIFLSAFGMESYSHEETAVRLQDNLPAGGFEVFACLGGMFLPLLGVHLAEEKQQESEESEKQQEHRTGNSGSNRGIHRNEYGRTVKKAGLAAAAIGGSLCAVTIGSYGKNGMEQIDFPTIRVMSNVRIPGGFMQRWDIIFLALILVCLTVTAAGSLWCVNEILAKLWSFAGEMRSDQKKEAETGEKAANAGMSSAKVWLRANRIALSRNICIILVYFLSAGFLSAWTAVCYYRALNLQLLIPGLFFFYIIVSFQRRRKQGTGTDRLRKHSCGRRKTVMNLSRGLALLLLLLVSVLLLGGCTSYEPEERLFPMAMQIDVENGGLVMTYAWNENAGPGSIAAAGSGVEDKSGDENKEDTGDADTGGLTVFRGASLEEIRKKTDKFTERYMDYSHVKAIIIDENLKSDSELEAEVMEWLTGESAFASGLIVYPKEESGLTLQLVQQRAGGEVGRYLENLYENNETYREKSTTLGRIIAEYYA